MTISVTLTESDLEDLNGGDSITTMSSDGVEIDLYPPS